MSYLQAVRVAPRVWWVGAIDWNLREFHGYRTGRGSTYNAFLVMDEKITLIDTVKAPFYGEMLERIASVVDPAKIDYIVSNHAEMDHSGALPRAVAELQPEKVFASTMGVKALAAHFGDALKIEAVKTGDQLNLGAGKLHFVESRMLHWPDSMLSFYDADKILFSQDGFGMHLAGSARFAAEYSDELLHDEAKKYFANILLPYAPRVTELLNALPGLGLDIDIIAPDHGPVWRNDYAKVIQWYGEFARQRAEARAVVVYDTMWGSTAKQATALADGLIAAGIKVDFACLHQMDRSDVMTLAMNAGILAVGTPTLNNNLYPSVADMLTYMRGLKPKLGMGFAFGSFGWSGEGVKQVGEYLTAMKIEQPLAAWSVKYVPTAADLTAGFNYGLELGNALLKTIAGSPAEKE